MRCQSCGAVIEDNSAFCTVCGARQDPVLRRTEEKYGSTGSAYDSREAYYSSGSAVGPVFSSVFREPLFLVITILMTVSAICALFSWVGNSTYDFEINLGAVLPILYAVALWLIFAEFRTDKPLYKNTGLAIASGTTKAEFILMWVAVGIIAVVMVLMIVFGNLLVNYLPYPFIEDLPDIFNDLPGGLGVGYPVANGIPAPSIPMPTNPGYNAQAISTSMMLIIVIGGLFAIALLIVFNLCFIRKLHRFIKSLCVSLKNDYLQVECVRPVKAWLIVAAVLNFIAAVNALRFAPFAAIGTICQGLAAIFASVLIGRHFGDRSYL